MPEERVSVSIDADIVHKAELIAQSMGTDIAQAIAEAVNIHFRKLITEEKISMESSYQFMKDNEEEIDYPLTMELPSKKYTFTPSERTKFSKTQAKNVNKAEQGDAQAQNVVGTYYESGNGFGKDYDKAIYWYTLSAEQGNSNAQYHLGVLYNKVKENPLIAYMWFEVARMCGFNITAIHKDYILRLTEKLSNRQLQLAQQEAHKKVEEIQKRTGGN